MNTPGKGVGGRWRWADREAERGGGEWGRGWWLMPDQGGTERHIRSHMLYVLLPAVNSRDRIDHLFLCKALNSYHCWDIKWYRYVLCYFFLQYKSDFSRGNLCLECHCHTPSTQQFVNWMRLLLKSYLKWPTLRRRYGSTLMELFWDQKLSALKGRCFVWRFTPLV